MSSRRERRKKHYQSPKVAPVTVQPQVRSDVLQNRISTGSAQIRTISSRTLKIILIAIVILGILWVTAPKPPAPPGGQNQSMADQKLTPIDLSTVKTTIPPVDTSAKSVLGDSFKEKLKLK